ncbi:potassium:proton antiporter [uncultured Pseudodesulfovibrio sp.]|uniref:potassium:proton antiporter n=1 Tax=uncultured Pseudodesulfovibrio sp. TaxID=2035858 RepID=UPI0029C6ED9B|nr:potassium:proton antiporter [uncultured Pseudodesulfovibrio sp.]
MHTLFKSSGLISWIACLLTLAYQGISWVLTASWPTITMMDTLSRIGIDLTSLIQSLPLEYAVKAAYVLSTTELAIALWWLGATFFALALVNKVVFKN